MLFMTNSQLLSITTSNIFIFLENSQHSIPFKSMKYAHQIILFFTIALQSRHNFCNSKCMWTATPKDFELCSWVSSKSLLTCKLISFNCLHIQFSKHSIQYTCLFKKLKIRKLVSRHTQCVQKCFCWPLCQLQTFAFLSW